MDEVLADGDAPEARLIWTRVWVRDKISRPAYSTPGLVSFFFVDLPFW